MFTGRGWLTLIFGVLIAAVAWNLGQRDLLWVGLFLTLLPLLALLITFLATRRIPVERTVGPPAQVACGETLQVRLKVRTPGVMFGTGNALVDRIPSPVGADRTVALPAHWSRAEHTVGYSLRPERRGRYRIGPITWRTADPLGFATLDRSLPSFTPIVVTPRVHPLVPIQEVSGVGFSGDARLLHTSLVGPDDALVREYRPRDDVRRIHWPTTARTGELMVRQEERTWNPSAVIVLDSRSAAHPDPEAFEWTVSTAASIAVHLLEIGFTIDLADSSGTVLRPRGGLSDRTQEVLEHLTDVGLHPAEHIGEATGIAEARTTGQFLIALVGHLADPDVDTLRVARRDRRICWAIVRDADPRAVAQLVRDGWQVAEAPPGTPVPEAWQAVAQGVAHAAH